MKPQVWFCEVCRALGAVVHEEHSDVLSVLYQIGDAHKKAAPHCHGETRVIVLENIKEDVIWLHGLLMVETGT